MITRRPIPPAGIGQIPDGADWPTDLVPAPELREWVMATFIREGARLFNEDHAHLAEADLEFMWASAAYRKLARTGWADLGVDYLIGEMLLNHAMASRLKPTSTPRRTT